MTSPNNQRFTLVPAQWYAVEIIGDEFSPSSDLRSYSPIRVDEVCSLGNRSISLSFYHANYPEGVRDKIYRLTTIERGQNYLLARSIEHAPVRLLLVQEITWAWLRLHFNVDKPTDGQDIARWLQNNF
jgi:hypothetical protein